MKKFSALLLAIVLLISIPFTVSAEPEDFPPDMPPEPGDAGFCGDDITYRIEYNVLYIEGMGDMYDYGWGESPFYEDERINTVIIGSGVTSIGNVTFTYCNNLTSITIPEGVTSIGDYAFACCENLSSITIPESMESLGEEAFSNCYKLTSIEIPNGITSFSRYVFYCCDNLEYNKYENGLYLGNEDNPYLVLADVISDECQTFEINENTKIVAGCAFNECFSLTSVTVPISVTYIGGDAFYNCPKLEVLNYIGSKAQFEAITIGDGKIVFLPENIVYNYGQSDAVASGECGENVEYTLTADGVLTISGTGDMYDYSETTAPWIKKPAAKLMLKAAPASGELPKVKKAIIEEGVTSIGGGAFADCDELAEIDIPTTVVSVGKNAFDGCDNLETVNYSASAYDFAKIEFADSGDVNILPKPKTAISCGDANGDGEINGSDLTILAQYIAKWSVSVSGGADANGDGEINGSDLTLLAQYIAKWSVILG